MAGPPPITSAVQLLALPDDGRRYELVRGELRAMSPAGGRHGQVASRLLIDLGAHVRDRGLGRTYAAETGFWVAREPDTARAPDAAFVAAVRLAAGEQAPGFVEGVPDLAAEVASPGESGLELEAKVRAWLAAGTRMVLLVDPRRRTVTVDRAPDEVLVRSGSATIDGADVVPGWRLPLADLFAD